MDSCGQFISRFAPHFISSRSPIHLWRESSEFLLMQYHGALRGKHLYCPSSRMLTKRKLFPFTLFLIWTCPGVKAGPFDITTYPIRGANGEREDRGGTSVVYACNAGKEAGPCVDNPVLCTSQGGRFVGYCFFEGKYEGVCCMGLNPANATLTTKPPAVHDDSTSAPPAQPSPPSFTTQTFPPAPTMTTQTMPPSSTFPPAPTMTSDTLPPAPTMTTQTMPPSSTMPPAPTMTSDTLPPAPTMTTQTMPPSSTLPPAPTMTSPSAPPSSTMPPAPTMTSDTLPPAPSMPTQTMPPSSTMPPAPTQPSETPPSMPTQTMPPAPTQPSETPPSMPTQTMPPAPTQPSETPPPAPSPPQTPAPPTPPQPPTFSPPGAHDDSTPPAPPQPPTQTFPTAPPAPTMTTQTMPPSSTFPPPPTMTSDTLPPAPTMTTQTMPPSSTLPPAPTMTSPSAPPSSSMPPAPTMTTQTLPPAPTQTLPPSSTLPSESMPPAPTMTTQSLPPSSSLPPAPTLTTQALPSETPPQTPAPPQQPAPPETPGLPQPPTSPSPPPQPTAPSQPPPPSAAAGVVTTPHPKPPHHFDNSSSSTHPTFPNFPTQTIPTMSTPSSTTQHLPSMTPPKFPTQPTTESPTEESTAPTDETPPPSFDVPGGGPCGQITTEIQSFFQNPSYPSLDTESNVYEYSVMPQEGYCALRIEFIEAILASKGMEGCSTDSVVIVNSADTPTTPLCGLLQGYQLTVRSEPEQPIKLVVTAQSQAHMWKINLTQISCQSIQPYQNYESPDCGIKNPKPPPSGISIHQNREEPKVIPPIKLLRSKKKHLREIMSAPFMAPSKLLQTAVLNRESSIKIVKGNETGVNEWPWQALLMVSGRPLCGASVINEEWIVTAGHCVQLSLRYPLQSVLTVDLGDHDLLSSKETRNVVMKVEKIVPNVQNEGVKNDIALIKLAQKINFGKTIRPVCLPEPKSPPDSFAGQTGITTGWGRTEDAVISPVLREAELPILSNERCRQQWSAVGEGAGSIIESGMVCVGGGDVGPCNGDSGGPLVVHDEDDDKWRLVGLTSFGLLRGCAVPGVPSVYARVTSYLDWLALNLAN